MRKLKPLGIDDEWSRPLYKDQDNNWYCDTSCRTSVEPEICYKQTKEGEPEFPISKDKYQIIKN